MLMIQCNLIFFAGFCKDINRLFSTFRHTYTIENAHSQTVRDIDFNPNKQYNMVSCSDDCKTKFWDTRNTDAPLMVRNDHSHW